MHAYKRTCEYTHMHTSFLHTKDMHSQHNRASTQAHAYTHASICPCDHPCMKMVHDSPVVVRWRRMGPICQSPFAGSGGERVVPGARRITRVARQSWPRLRGAAKLGLRDPCLTGGVVVDVVRLAVCCESCVLYSHLLSLCGGASMRVRVTRDLPPTSCAKCGVLESGFSLQCDLVSEAGGKTPLHSPSHAHSPSTHRSR